MKRLVLIVLLCVGSVMDLCSQQLVVQKKVGETYTINWDYPENVVVDAFIIRAFDAMGGNAPMQVIISDPKARQYTFVAGIPTGVQKVEREYFVYAVKNGVNSTGSNHAKVIIVR